MEFDARYRLALTVNDRELSLTLAEGLALSLTNPTTIKINGVDTFLTSKTIYFWAAFSAYLVTQRGNDEIDRIVSLVEGFAEWLTRSNESLFPRASNDIEYILHLISYFDMDADVINYIVKDAESTYNSLLRQDLIVDPPKIFWQGAILAIVGLFPTEFTYKTDKGNQVDTKYQTMLIEYSQKKVDDIVIEKHFQASETLKNLLTTVIGGVTNVHPTPPEINKSTNGTEPNNQ